jgi:hypothetical protein
MAAPARVVEVRGAGLEPLIVTPSGGHAQVMTGHHGTDSMRFLGMWARSHLVLTLAV